MRVLEKITSCVCVCVNVIEIEVRKVNTMSALGGDTLTFSWEKLENLCEKHSFTVVEWFFSLL